MGPVDKVEFKDLHCSPLLLHPKYGNERRIILNLSYPKGNSVNDRVDISLFDGHPLVLKFPTINDIVQEITRDVAFGWMLRDAITNVMAWQTYRIFAYIDDFVAVSPIHQSDEAFCALSHLIYRLDLLVNENKRNSPCKALTRLGINIDLTTNVLSIYHDKLQAIYSECVKTRSKKCLSRKVYQSLLCKLLYLHKCVHPARIFVYRILYLFRQNHDKIKITLTPDVCRDSDWFLHFLPYFNGTFLYKKPPPHPQDPVYVDASLTGIGGWERSSLCFSHIPNA